MDVTEITNLIGNVYFPIAACIIMFMQNSKMHETLTKLSETLSLMSERLKDVEDAIKKGE